MSRSTDRERPAESSRVFTLDCEQDFPLADPSDHRWKDRLWKLFEELVHPDIVLHGVPRATSGVPSLVRPVSSRWEPTSPMASPPLMCSPQKATRPPWCGPGEATHSQEVMGAAPTGRRVKVQAVMVQRVDNGKIVEHWVGFDSLRWLEQLGLVGDDVSTIGKGHAVG